jgi:cephalosporin-C deacetylase-like acetyl esterase
MKKIIVLLALVAFGGLSAAAQQTGQAPFVKVNIVPTKMSWDYAAGETIKMEVSILKDELPLQDQSFRWEAGPEMMPAAPKEGNTGKGAVTLDLGKMREPGFFTLNVSVEVDGVRYNQWKTVSVDRDRIAPTVKMPADFQAYWDAQRALDDAMPLAPEMRLLPERCTSAVDVYEVSYTYTRGGRMYGILCVPKAPGKYPAILNVPGAGIRPYGGSVGTAARGYIVLDVGIHGISVTLDPKVYNNLGAGALGNYQLLGMENRDNYYYNKVYRGCRRGVDFIFSLPQFDGNIGVAGGSQGGALAVIVGALDSRVKCVSSIHPALSDLTGYLYGRAGGWPHMLRNPEGNVFNDPQFIETLSYYDVVNFARILRAPAFFTMGYNDKVCPPTSTFSVYNSVTAPKELLVVPQTAHWTFSEQNAASAKFLDSHLKK